VNAVVGTIQPDNNEKLQTYPAAAQQSAAREDFSAAVTAYKRAVEADPQTAGPILG
jgi:lipopolysaccharide biosynthesis regulator YciM